MITLFNKDGSAKKLVDLNNSVITEKGGGVDYIIGRVSLEDSNDSTIQNWINSLWSENFIIFDVIIASGSAKRLHGYKYTLSSKYARATLEDYFGNTTIYSENNGVWKTRTI